MKSRPRSFFAPVSQLSVIACASLYAVADVNAADAAWLAAPATGNWVEGTNWVGGSAPGATTGTTNTDTATFNTSSTIGAAVVVDANRNLQNITFGANFTYTFSGGPLLLTTGGTILSNGNSGDQRINAPIQLQGNAGTYKIQTDTPGTNREMIIATGGITGVSAAANNTTLTLTGNSPGSNAISAVIGNGSGGGSLSLVKEGVGLWILSSGANTYSGGTTVTGGTLRSDNSGLSSLALGTGPVTINGGTLRFQSTQSPTVITFDNTFVTTANGGSISFRANSTFNPPSLTSTSASILSLTADTGATVTTTSYQNYAGVLNLGNGVGSNTFRLSTSYVESSLASAYVNLAAFASVTRQSGTNGNLTTQIGTLAGAAGSFIGGSAPGGGTITLRVGARGDSSTFSGSITDGGTPTALEKIGAGTLILNGPNTYTRNTAVEGGTLSITHAYLADASTVSISAGAVMNLNFGGSDVVGTLRLGTPLATVPPGIYNSTTPGYESYFTGPGSIRVGVASAYDDWAIGYGLQIPWDGIDPATNGTPTGDPDNDGQANSIEFAMGGSPVSGSDNAKFYSLTADSDTDVDATPELLLTIAVLNGTFPFSNAAAPTATIDGVTYTIQGSTTLDAFATAVTPTILPVTTGLPPAPAGYTYRTFSLSGSNGLAGKGFLRAVITNP